MGRVLSSSRVVVVTGGAHGIGRAIVERFVADGWCAVVADIREPDALPQSVVFVPTDVSEVNDVNRLMTATTDRFGRVDLLVNNAGIWFARPFLEISPDEWDRVVAVNLRGTFLCTRAAVPHLRSQRGSIINIGSQAGLAYTRGQGAHYHSTKASVTHLTRVLAFELGPMDIRVNCVAPGATPAVPGTFPEELLAQIPLGRVGSAADVAAACAFLASPDAAFVTGQTLLVNGGAIAFL